MLAARHQPNKAHTSSRTHLGVLAGGRNLDNHLWALGPELVVQRRKRADVGGVGVGANRHDLVCISEDGAVASLEHVEPQELRGGMAFGGSTPLWMSSLQMTVSSAARSRSSRPPIS